MYTRCPNLRIQELFYPTKIPLLTLLQYPQNIGKIIVHMTIQLYPYSIVEYMISNQQYAGLKIC